MEKRLGRWFGAVTLGAIVAVGAGCATQVEEDAGERGGESVDALASQAQAIVGQAKAAGWNFTWKLDTKYRRAVLTGTFPGVDGNPRRFRLYKRLGLDRGLVLFLNGRVEFIEKYDPLFTSVHEYPSAPVGSAQTLADLPVSFITLDHAGQGASTAGTIPGHIDSYDTFVKDAERLVSPAFLFGDGPRRFIVMGHSMGGLVATRFAQANASRVRALVLTSPLFGIGAPPPATPEQVQQLAYAYSLPPPAGFGLADRCARVVDPLTLGTIAQCLSNAGCRQCFEAPVADPNVIPACAGAAATFPPGVTWTSMRTGWATLQSPSSIGCKVSPDVESSKAGCAFGTPAFSGLTTDKAYCEWYSAHPLRGPQQTFGWLKASYDAIAAAKAEAAKLTMPVKVLVSPIDPIAVPSAMTSFCGSVATCTASVYAPNPSAGLFYFHELLAETNRAVPIQDVQDFIASQL